jgi:hypothetical protein
MASNTTVGPASSTGPALPVKPHQTFNKTDDTDTDGFSGNGAAGSNTTLNPYSGPVNNGGS